MVERMRSSLAERQARPYINVWADDPPAPPTADEVARSLRDAKKKEKKDKDKHKSHRKDKHGGNDSEKESKHKRRGEKDKHKHKKRRHKKSRHHSDESSYDSDASGASDSYSSDDSRRDRRKKDKKDKKRRRPDLDADLSMMDESKREEFELMQEMRAKKQKTQEVATVDSKEEDDGFGPAPMREVGLAKGYGAAMLPGEADAYASYVQDNKRIPRRGEIGLTAEEIEKFEQLGYQMSGSRHRRMNAVRIRKEGQIYSHEEQRILAQVNNAERQKRENQVVADFRSMLSSKIKEHAQDLPPPKP